MLLDQDRYQMTKAQILAEMDVMMGGRAAEELYSGADKVTTGASSDLHMATVLATQMVKEYGMSEKVRHPDRPVIPDKCLREFSVV